MKEIEKQIPISVGVNNTQKRITIFFKDLKKKLVLKDIAICYATGIIGKKIVELNQRKQLGTAFEWEIRSTGGNPDDYIWIQISARGPQGEYALLEGAVREISLEKKFEDDFF